LELANNEKSFPETEIQTLCSIIRQFMCFRLFSSSHPPSATRLRHRWQQQGHTSIFTATPIPAVPPLNRFKLIPTND